MNFHAISVACFVCYWKGRGKDLAPTPFGPVCPMCRSSLIQGYDLDEDDEQRVITHLAKYTIREQYIH